MRVLPILLIAALAAGCQKSGNGLAGGSGSAAPIGSGTDLDSKDILARKPVTDDALVKHVLVGWKDLAAAYRGHMDPKAAARSQEEAAKIARDVYAKLTADPSQIDALIQSVGEDPGAKRGEPYEITPDAGFVPEFKNLALRLNVKEVGIVKSDFGYHVIERVAPPPLDPLESADILARPAEPGQVFVQHVLVGWKDAPAVKAGQGSDAAKARSKADADALAKQIFDQAKGGADFTQLMKQYSEDPGSKDSGMAYPVDANAQLVPTFKKLSLRLKMNEVGMVISPFGWHIIKRVAEPPPPPPPPPPTPDALDSKDILARQPVTQKAKVKHILLGWTEVHADDPRGASRSRADLEKLVADTVAKLKKGAPIEPLMKELSEDPGSAQSGDSYDVSPDAQLVEPFKNLSLRLNVGEVGVVKTQFGIHIIKRVE